MPAFADPVRMQHRLFAELSRMFGQEVPLYDKSLLVNRACNRAACALVGDLYPGFSIADADLDRDSGERHGAIRIGTPEEYRWVCRFFSLFAMEPHNFYDMTSVGARSQPVIATAYRSRTDPHHRVFCSLLMTDWFDPATRERIESLLASRHVFTDAARALVEKAERDGGLEWNDADALIREAVERIFKWTGTARDHRLFTELCEAGFKIAADIACFDSHHLNHLTPNTFCIDLYTAAMKRCLGEIDEPEFRRRAADALHQLARSADRHWIRLHFRHLGDDEIAALRRSDHAAGEAVERIVETLERRLDRPDVDLRALPHAGFKDFTEGPSADTPVLLRQDAYKALTERVRFREADGSVVEAPHTARFGEIEQRFYATTPKGLELYDRCLAAAEAERAIDPSLAQRNHAAYQAMYARHFAAIPKTLPELVEQGLVHARYEPTAAGLAAAQGEGVGTADVRELVRRGFVRIEGLRYEDFLPVSAAGIFASNLNQYGTRSTATQRPTYTQATLEAIIGRPIVDAEEAYRAVEAQSIADTLARLGVGAESSTAARKTAASGAGAT